MLCGPYEGFPSFLIRDSRIRTVNHCCYQVSEHVEGVAPIGQGFATMCMPTKSCNHTQITCGHNKVKLIYYIYIYACIYINELGTRNTFLVLARTAYLAEYRNNRKNSHCWKRHPKSRATGNVS